MFSCFLTGKSACTIHWRCSSFSPGTRSFPRWVFGVRARPFVAHCWVQYEDMVFNDTVEHVPATPRSWWSEKDWRVPISGVAVESRRTSGPDTSCGLWRNVCESGPRRSGRASWKPRASQYFHADRNSGASDACLLRASAGAVLGKVFTRDIDTPEAAANVVFDEAERRAHRSVRRTSPVRAILGALCRHRAQCRHG